jgi:hypothetical protein
VVLFRSAIVFLFFVVFSVISCKTISTDDAPGSPEEIVFRDRTELLETRIPSGSVAHSFEGTNYDFYVFEWWDGESLSSRIEIRILGAGFRDHLAGDYETFFQKQCGCNILKKGWVLVAGQKGREFVFTIEDGKKTAIERHLQWKGKMIQLQGLAPTANQELMKKRLQTVQSNLQLL